MRRSRATGAQRVIVTHGSVPVMVRWLRRAGPAGRRPSTPSTATSGGGRRTRSAAGGRAHEALRRACTPSSTPPPPPTRKVEALQRYFAQAPAARRGLGGVLPRRRQAAPGGADGACWRCWPARWRGIADVAVRRVLPGRGRPGRDHRARAAARRASRPTSGLAEWMEERLLPLRGLTPSGDRRRACRSYWRGARRAGPLPADQAGRRRLSGRRAASCWCSARWPRTPASTPSGSRSA